MPPGPERAEGDEPGHEPAKKPPGKTILTFRPQNKRLTTEEREQKRLELMAKANQARRDKLATLTPDDVKLLRISVLPGLGNISIRSDDPLFAQIIDLLKQAKL